MPISTADQERIKRVTLAIRQEHDRLRSKYSWLKFQDLIGFGLLVVSASMILVFSWLWHIEIISTWFLVIWVAFWTSILHELEHDLIHG
ncbi:MAG: hypothetical protein FJY17_06495 [Bacteroidetes bacterium]|nr:hypothetical protein [Bacteroidota bacterium]